jgi:hypothetical protein
MSLLNTNFKEFFKNLLPEYFVDNDTYKDVNGEGLLKRYMALFGENIDNELSSEIENYLNIIDASIADERFLNHISDTLGNPPDVFNNVGQYRNLLSYIVSVYKIKGTKRAYELFFSILGFVVEIYEIPILQASSNYDNNGVYDNSIDIDLYDQNVCQPCSFYTIAFYYRNNPSQPVSLETFDLLRAAITFNEPINAKLRSFTLVVILEDEMSLFITETEPITTLEPVNFYDTEREYDEELDEEVVDPIDYNFDITEDWGEYGVINEATFITEFLENTMGAISYNLSDFNLIGNRLKCNLTNFESIGFWTLAFILNGAIIHKLELNNIITSSQYSFSAGGVPFTIEEITLTNDVVQLTFDNMLNEVFNFVLPSSIEYIYFNACNINTFLSVVPDTLTDLVFESCNLTLADYESMEDWANSLPVFISCIFNFSNNTDSVSGTTLESILISKNATVIA